ncbi:MAG: dehydrogenase [Planctomycetaceae bacterium]|nr:dehydrogenase [Planctomycetaceae bacterium]|tara:strand:- start:4002 stop:5717 length:1716 start_codon:yes stop_codon:yes gene_type:complete
MADHVSSTESKNAARKSESGASPFTRRDLLRGGLAAGVVGGIGLGSVYFGYGSSLRDPVRVGVIGTGDEGGVLMGAINPDYVQVTAIADIRPYNIYRAFHGDSSSTSALAARPGLIAKYGYADETDARRHIAVYEDAYEAMLDDPDIEGIIVALPLHLHAEASIKAMRKGKHVICEKLMAHSVGQCKEMARTASKSDQILAVGHQRHYSILYDNAREMIRRGMIGDLHHIRAQWHRGNLPGRDSWQQPLPDDALRREMDRYALESAELLDSLSADNAQWNPAASSRRDMAEAKRKLAKMRLLDASIDPTKYGYQAPELRLPDGTVKSFSPHEELIRWRLWNRTGGGLMAELGSHQLDAASIFVSALRDDGKKVHPLSVTAVGGRHLFPPDRDAADHVYCNFEFPSPQYDSDPNKKIVVTYSSINGNGYGGYGEVVMGTKGTIVIDREKEVELYRKDQPTSVQADKTAGPVLDTTESGAYAAAETKASTGPVSRGYTEEIEHWAWCIRNRDPLNQPRCGPKVALADAVIALVANQAINTESRVQFDPAWFDPDDDATPEGNAPNVNRKEYSV